MRARKAEDFGRASRSGAASPLPARSRPLVSARLLYFGAVTQQPPLIATVESGGRPLFVATIDPKRHTIAVVPAAFIPDPTRIPELWLIGADGKPRAVGPLRADRTVIIALSPALADEAKIKRDACCFARTAGRTDR